MRRTDTIWDHSVRSAKTQMIQSTLTVLADHKERLPVQLKLHSKVRPIPSYTTLSLTRSKPIGSPVLRKGFETIDCGFHAANAPGGCCSALTCAGVI